MATHLSTYATALASTALHTRANQHDVTHKRRVAHFSYTLKGTEVVNDDIDLGPLGIPDALINAESCRVRFSGAGTINVAGKLQVKTGTAAAVDVSASATLNASAVVTLAPATVGPAVAAGKETRLRFLLGTVTTVTAGRVLHFEVGYDAN